MLQASETIQQAFRFIANGEIEQAEQLYQQLKKHFSTHADVQHLHALICERSGQFRQGMQSIQRAIKQQPDNPIYSMTLSKIQYAMGKQKAAEQTLLRILEKQPNMVAAHFQLGIWYTEQRRFREAELQYRHALEIQTDNASLYNNLGTVLHEQGNYQEAIECYQHALALQPGYLTALINMANSQKNMESYADAAETFKQVLKLRPELAEPHVQLGEMLRYQGVISEAVEEYRKAIRLQPNFTEAYRLLSTFQSKHQQSEVDAMEALDDDSLSDVDRMHLQFALMKVYEDRGETDKAFSAMLQANRLFRANINYDVKTDVDFMQRLIKAFTADFFARYADCSTSTATPVFIIGMPRSGTTLTESILASHPDVFGAGEITVLADIINASVKPYPEGRKKLNCDNLTAMATSYIEQVASLNEDGNKLVVNKMPSNFLYLGLINLLFPQARVIHCVRDPLDTCLSCFKQYFIGWQPFAYDLQDLGCYYAAYHQLMAHWRTVLPGFMYELKYEDMVASPEKNMRELLEFCGLKWDEKCLEFNRHNRQVRTASSAQVRQPIYQTSTYAWEKYREHLQPLIQCLQEQGVLE